MGKRFSVSYGVQQSITLVMLLLLLLFITFPAGTSG
jgi:hypothetical protein